ncbi:MAG: hypothetical protein GXY20_03460 [Clostridiales bacterium]|nr:hypothetical protein [Clostridiales bacterium]
MSKRRRKRARRSLFLLILIALFVWALVRSNGRVVTPESTVTSPYLPVSFDGMRIAVVADTHGNYDERITQAVKSADPDLIAVAGDLVDSLKNKYDAQQFDRAVGFISGLTRIAPVYYVTGNHEWATGEAYELIERVEAAGATVLSNEWEEMTVGTESIIIAGVHDPNGPYDMMTPKELLTGFDAKGRFTVFLSHRPDHFEDYAALGADLVVSGHVHGGMVRIPIIGGLFSPGMNFFPEYDGGVFRSGDSDMILSRGLTGVYFFPRLFNPREVPVVTLRVGG